MRSKVLIAVLAAMLMTAGSGVNRALVSLEHSTQVLYLLAQYKVWTGNNYEAAQLIRKATSAEPSPRAFVRARAGNCRYMHQG